MVETSWKLITLANREVATMALKMCRGNSPETCLKFLCLKHRTSYTTDSDSDRNWSIGLALSTGNQWGFEQRRIQVGYAVALLFSSFFHGWLRRGKLYSGHEAVWMHGHRETWQDTRSWIWNPIMEAKMEQPWTTYNDLRFRLLEFCRIWFCNVSIGQQ